MSFEVFLKTVREKVSLVRVVERHVKLVRRGHHYLGLCPFHNEKTPSFHVDETKGRYHCFGCKNQGDIFDFLQQMENRTFMQAVGDVAEIAGISMPVDRESSALMASLRKIMEKACRWFEKNLHGPVGKQAQDYLAKRGIGPNEILKFRLGYAPPSQELLSLFQPHERPLLEKAGLIAPDHKPFNGYYQRFRDRIMFPILDHQGRPVGFGGRILGVGKNLPKYLNSPETLLFSKRTILYGSCGLSKVESLAIVEGYLDVIALHPFMPAVAPLGTALNTEHLEKIWHYSNHPIVCFDADTAGEKASLQTAIRALSVLKPGRNLFFARLPKGEDPQSMVHSQGWGALESVLKEAIPLSTWLWNQVSKDFSHGLPETKAKALGQWREWLGHITDPSVRDSFYQFLADKKRTKSPTTFSVPNCDENLSEKILMGLLLLDTTLLWEVQEHLAVLSLKSPLWKRVLDFVLEWMEQCMEEENPHTPDLSSMPQSLRCFLEEKMGFFPDLSSISPLFLSEHNPKAHWIERFNHHQKSMGQTDEILALQKKMSQTPTEEDWKRLQQLRRLSMAHDLPPKPL